MELQFENNIEELQKSSIFSFQHETGINADGSFRLFQGTRFLVSN
jgi:hypothetical protein